MMITLQAHLVGWWTIWVLTYVAELLNYCQTEECVEMARAGCGRCHNLSLLLECLSQISVQDDQHIYFNHI